ncbi:hypothetical protein [Streptomyces sp. NPDC048845]|uniref:hypothetical protein n=1 Tax=Streptomyces sp. NPDC048845 TaxID=3155390 RepID=UPI00342C8AE3
MDRKNAERLLSGEPPLPGGEPVTADLDRLLAAAARPLAVDPARAEAGEQAALEAFRAARAEALRAAGEPRRRDDWGVARWRGRLFPPAGHRPARVALAGVLAAGALVGALFVAGTGGFRVPFTDVDSASTQEPEDGTATATAGGPAGSRPAPETDWREPHQELPGAEELCRTYLGEDGGGNGGAGNSGAGNGEGDSSRLDAEGYARLVASAGGERKVDGYCAGMLGAAGSGEPEPGGSADSGSDNANAGSGNAGSGSAGPGGDNANSGGSNADAGSDHANSGGNNANSGGSEANSGGNDGNSGNNGNNGNSGGDPGTGAAGNPGGAGADSAAGGN